MTAITNVPDYQVVVDGRDITPRLKGLPEDGRPRSRPRLLSLHLSEKRGGDADQLEIAIDDGDGAVALPRAGATITVRLGWRAGSDVTVGLVDKGKFIVDEIEHGGPPDRIVIRARSADLTSAIRTRRDHSWHATTLGAIVRQVAARNALKVHVAPALAAHPVPALTQGRESDMAPPSQPAAPPFPTSPSPAAPATATPSASRSARRRARSRPAGTTASPPRKSTSPSGRAPAPPGSSPAPMPARPPRKRLPTPNTAAPPARPASSTSASRSAASTYTPTAPSRRSGSRPRSTPSAG